MTPDLPHPGIAKSPVPFRDEWESERDVLTEDLRVEETRRALTHSPAPPPELFRFPIPLKAVDRPRIASDLFRRGIGYP